VKQFQSVFPIQNSDKMMKGANFGILSAQIQHDLNPNDVVKGSIYHKSTINYHLLGLIIDEYNNRSYLAKSPLSFKDAYFIDLKAKQIWRLDSAVKWMQTSLKMISNEETSRFKHAI